MHHPFSRDFSGDWDVHWGYDVDFDPQPNVYSSEGKHGSSLSADETREAKLLKVPKQGTYLSPLVLTNHGSSEKGSLQLHGLLKPRGSQFQSIPSGQPRGHFIRISTCLADTVRE